MENNTLCMEDELFNTLPYDDEEDCIELLDFLNSDGFRSYGDSLKEIIRNKMPGDISMSEMDYLISAAKSHNITIGDKRTLKSWFNNDVRPKKGNDNRVVLFKIAFSLDLTEEETRKLFEKVILDRAYNPRDYRDAIYYYCLKNGRSFDEANEIIERVSLSEKKNTDDTISTRLLSADISQAISDEVLIEYINSHSHNFFLNNISAKKVKDEYLSKAIESAKDERKKYDYTILSDKEKKSASLVEKQNSSSYGKVEGSINYLYETITGQSIEVKGGGTKFSFKNALLPKEIKNCFPSPHTISADEPTYEELRKIIILLYSYVYWRKMDDDDSLDFDDYRIPLDILLTEIGFLPLYACNPYDWLFLRCTLSERPIDLFRDILFEAFE